MITAKEARQESNKATERKVSRERIQSKKVERKVRKAKCT